MHGTLSTSNIQTSNLTVTNSHEVIGTLSASNIQTSNLTVTNSHEVIGTLSASNDASIGGIVIQGGGLTTTSSYLFDTSPGFTTDRFIYSNAVVNSRQTDSSPAAIVFGNGNIYGSNQISLVIKGE